LEVEEITGGGIRVTIPSTAGRVRLLFARLFLETIPVAVAVVLFGCTGLTASLGMPWWVGPIIYLLGFSAQISETIKLFLQDNLPATIEVNGKGVRAAGAVKDGPRIWYRDQIKGIVVRHWWLSSLGTLQITSSVYCPRVTRLGIYNAIELEDAVDKMKLELARQTSVPSAQPLSGDP
jgi:hypothetical protein